MGSDDLEQNGSKETDSTDLENAPHRPDAKAGASEAESESEKIKPETAQDERHERDTQYDHTEQDQQDEEQSSRFRDIYVTIRSALIYLEKDPFVRFFVALLFIGTFLQLSIDLVDRRDERAFRAEEREYRRQERVARSWSELLNPSTGNSARVRALEFLFSQGESFNGIDLSCEAMQRGWDDENLVCQNPIDLSGLDLSSQRSTASAAFFHDRFDVVVYPDQSWEAGCLAFEADLDEARFLHDQSLGSFQERHPFLLRQDEARDAVRATGADFRSAKLSGVRFGNAKMSGANFDAADLRGSFFENADLEAASFDGSNLAGVEFELSFLMGATLSDSFVQTNKTLFNRDSRHSEKVNFEKKLKISNSWLDGAKLDFSRYHTNFLEVKKSTLKNAQIDIIATPRPLEKLDCQVGDSELDFEIFAECWEANRFKHDFEMSDLSCSWVKNDYGLSFTGSNLSHSRFPNRYVENEESTRMMGAHGLTTIVHKVVNSTGKRATGWSPTNIKQPLSEGENLDLPWVWSDATPTGNLYGEVIAVCEQKRKSAYVIPQLHGFHGSGRGGSIIPDECWTQNASATGKTISLLTFPELKSRTEFEEMEQRLLRDFFESKGLE